MLVRLNIFRNLVSKVRLHSECGPWPWGLCLRKTWFSVKSSCMSQPDLEAAHSPGTVGLHASCLASAVTSELGSSAKSRTFLSFPAESMLRNYQPVKVRKFTSDKTQSWVQRPHHHTAGDTHAWLDPRVKLQDRATPGSIYLRSCGASEAGVECFASM